MQLTYIGNCKNLFDENGNCLTNHFVDVSDMANAVEHSEFIHVMKLPYSIFEILPNSFYEFTTIGNIVFAYDDVTDIDYVFEIIQEKE